MANFLSDAFKKLDALNEDTFDLTHDGIEELKDFKETDKVDDTIFIIDPDAKDEDELEDSYIGKIILDCDVCHSLIYKDKEDVHVDDETQEVNADEECPYCFTTGGFKIIGEVKEFDGFEEKEDDIDDVEDEVEVKDEVEEEKVEEACSNKKLKELDRKHAKDLAEKNDKSTVKIYTESAKLGKYVIRSGVPAANPYTREYSEETGKHFGYLGYGGRSWVPIDSEYIMTFDSVEEANAAAKKHVKSKYKAEIVKVTESSYSESLKEDIGKDLARFQKWVDYDMKRYGKISERTNDLISKAGLEVVKDDYGDYEVIAKDFKEESLKEDFKDVEITTDDSHMKMTSDEDGKVTVTTEKLPAGEEVIAPLSDEVEDEIEMGSEEEIEEPSEDEEEFDFDEVEDFDELGESYLKKVYENINSFKTTKCTEKGNKLMLEGVISFNSGNSKKTSFIFEAKDSIGNGRIRFIGENKNIASGKPYLMTAVIDNKRLFTESLKYNYATKSGRVRGEVKR